MYANVVETGEPLLLDDVSYPLERTGGQVRRYEIRALPADDGFVLSWRDVTERHMVQRARDTLSAALEVILGAETELDLLRAICRVTVEVGDYRDALYARAGVQRQLDVVARCAAAPDVVSPATLLGRSPTRRALATGKRVVDQDLRASVRSEAALRRFERLGVVAAASVPVYVDGELDGVFTVYAADNTRFGDHELAVLADQASQIGLGLDRVRSTASLKESLHANRLLRAATDQATDAILLADASQTIVYANPAAATSSGIPLSEIIGQRPTIFRDGLYEAGLYERVWADLRTGNPYQAVLTSRRRNGELYEEDVTVSPVLDDTGAIMAFAAVKRDLSAIRRAEAALMRSRSDREAALDVMRDVRLAESIEETAASLSQSMLRLEQIDASIILLINAAGEFVPVGSVGDVGIEFPLGVPVSVPAADRVLDLLRQGAVSVDLAETEGWTGGVPDFAKFMVAAGFRIGGYAPIRWEGETVGALAITSRAPDAAQWMDDRLPVLEELGAFAGMLFGARAQLYGETHALRRRMREVIDERRFHIVMQPIVDVASGATVGYEALTRFDDEVPPWTRFAQAHEIGLGPELESACARAALRASATLPEAAWLSLNFSPAALLDGTACSVTAEADGRPLVIEITEHTAITSYEELRQAVGRCRNARLAVDDAGAGFASLRHILELKPDFVKLDLDLVRGIHLDPARQALAAGLHHFCSAAGMVLIAEGVETVEEADMLRELGVDMAQGHLFGRPERPPAPPARTQR
ncbi:MAG: EAL domain-containing protein [Ilumatobacter sp.]|nr:EAL domain-containing protein [Ilumatobacter sp.]